MCGDYYVYIAEIDKSECQVLTDEKVCGVKIKWEISGAMPKTIMLKFLRYWMERTKKKQKIFKKGNNTKSSSQY